MLSIIIIIIIVVVSVMVFAIIHNDSFSFTIANLNQRTFPGYQNAAAFSYASTCTVASLLSDSYKVKHCCSLSREDQQVMEEGVCLVMSASSATSSSLGSLTDR